MLYQSQNRPALRYNLLLHSDKISFMLFICDMKNTMQILALCVNTTVCLRSAVNLQYVSKLYIVFPH